MTHILILVGSERLGFNDALATAAARLLREHATVERYGALAQLPHFHEELDASGLHATVDDFRDAVRKSDALLLITPEYNGGPSSLIKNALDVASRPRTDAAIQGKPVAVIGATPSPGMTAGAREALLRGLQVAGAEPLEASFGIGQAYRHLGEQGYDQEVLVQLQHVVKTLVRAAVLSREKVA